MPAAASTVMAAAMESAGYKGQSLVLEQLGTMLNGLGFLIFVIAGVVAISAYAIFGGDGFDPKKFLWFLVGPTVYYFMTYTLVRSPGAEWQFGDFKGKQQILDDRLGEKIDAEVSWAFDKYNRLISSIVQNTISILSNDEIRAQLIFTNREHMMNYVMSSDIGNPGLLALIHTGLRGQCGRFLEAARTISLGNRDPQYQKSSAYKDAAASYFTLLTQQNVAVSGEPVLYSYLEALLTSWRANPGRDEFINNRCDPGETIGVLRSSFTLPVKEVLGSPVSCQQIWCWTAMGLNSEAKEIMARAAKQAKDNPTAESVGPAEADRVILEAWNDIAVKMGMPDPDLPLLPGETRTRTVPDPSVIAVVAGGMLLKRELMRDPRSIMTTRFGQHSGIFTAPVAFSTKTNEREAQERLRKHNMAEQVASLQAETFMFAATLPHIQGFLLYALSILFPFFALFLIVPGQAGNFLSWFALWAWVKSWDVGFSLVMIADELLWQMMPHSAFVDSLVDPNHSPITVMEAAFSADPSYSLGTYYMLLSVMLTAIPIATAHMVLGGKAAIAGVLGKGLSRIGEGLGGSAADMHAAKQIAQIDFLRNEADIRATRQHINGLITSTGPGGDMFRHLLASGKNEQPSKDVINAIANKVEQTTGSKSTANDVRNVLSKFKPAQLAFVAYDMTAGAKMRQASNTAAARLVEIEGNEALFKTNRLGEAQSMDAIRAGMSNRVHFWERYSAQNNLVSSRMLFDQAYQNSMTEAEYKAAGQAVDMIRRIVPLP